MQKGRIEKYRRRLEQHHQDLRQRLMRQGEAIRTANDEAPEDSAAEAAKSYSKEFSFRQNDSDFAQLAQVEEALRRIDSVQFGICESCEEKIELKRLDAVPWTRYCRSCQELEEELNPASNGNAI